VIDFARFREIADEAGALLMADIAHIAGLVAAGIHPSPIGHCHFVTTTTHKTLRGPRAGMVMCQEAFAKEIDRAVFPGLQGGPLMHIIAAKAVALKEAQTEEWRAYQRQVVANARRLAERLMAEKVRVVTGGTDNHLFLLDVASVGLTGKVAEKALEAASITTNKNTIPYDPNPPLVASGIRLGTPALTSRDMGEAEMDIVGGLIAEVLRAPEDEGVRTSVRGRVREICERFPLYDALA
jgi:glycine hydroxymethyltransferase